MYLVSTLHCSAAVDNILICMIAYGPTVPTGPLAMDWPMVLVRGRIEAHEQRTPSAKTSTEFAVRQEDA